jgi:hypothetical protein
MRNNYKYSTSFNLFAVLYFSQPKAVAVPVTSTFHSLSKLSTNYTIVICINNNVTINNYYGIFQYFILLFKIPMGTLKNFFEMYRQFVHVSSKNLRQP